MKRAVIVLLGVFVNVFSAIAQEAAQPTTAAEALAIANVKIEEGTLPHHEFARRVGALLVDERFDALEIIANEIRESKERWEYGQWKLWTFYSGTDEGRGRVRPGLQPMPYLQRLNRWVEVYPNSVTAKIALARVRKNLAWRARSGGWAKDVSEEGWAGMKRHLNAAQKTLEEAEALDVPDPELYTVWVRVALGLSKSGSEIHKLYEKGIAQEPGYPALYQARAWSLMPRWGGRPGELESFAKSAVGDASTVPGTGAYVWIVNIINLNTAPTTLLHRFEWSPELLRQGFDDVLTVYPESMYMQNLRARLCSFLDDKEEAQKAFAVIGRDFSPGIWPDKFVYFRWKRWAENDADWPGGNGIHYGVRWDSPVICSNYLQSGDVIDAVDESGLTPLHYAAKLGMVEAARFLLSEGADVSDGKGTMVTPLFSAARYGHTEMVTLLIDHGADPAIHTRRQGSTALIAAAARGELGVAKILLEQPSVDVDALDKKGRTALYLVSTQGRHAMIKLLLDAGADINLPEKSGKTPLAGAQQYKKTKAVQLLKARGATL